MNDIKQAVIVAGGLGKRLKEHTQGKPKILIDVGEETLLDVQLRQLVISGFRRCTFLLGYQAEEIIDILKAKSHNYPLIIDWVVEPKALGTGGSLINALDKLENVFIVIYGDLYLNLDFKALEKEFFLNDASFACVVHPSSHAHDSDLFEIEQNGRIKKFISKHEARISPIRNIANSGIYIFRRNVLEKFSVAELDLDRDIVQNLIIDGEAGLALRNKGYVRDVGTLERLKKIKDMSSSPEISIRKRPALFLDRDGVLNRHVGHITSIEQIQIFPKIISLISRFNDAGYLVIVLTNQPIIAHGKLDFEGLNAIHASIDFELSRHHAYIDQYYICPHHPDSGYKGEVKDLKKTCDCRKPKIGLLLQCLADFDIDLTSSIFIGDTWRDEELARQRGIPYISVNREEELESEVDKKIDSIQPKFRWGIS